MSFNEDLETATVVLAMRFALKDCQVSQGSSRRSSVDVERLHFQDGNVLKWQQAAPGSAQRSKKLYPEYLDCLDLGDCLRRNRWWNSAASSLFGRNLSQQLTSRVFVN